MREYAACQRKHISWESEAVDLVKMVLSSLSTTDSPKELILYKVKGGWRNVAEYVLLSLSHCLNQIEFGTLSSPNIIDFLHRNHLTWSRRKGRTNPGDPLWESLGRKPRRNFVLHMTEDIGVIALDFRKAGQRQERIATALANTLHFFRKTMDERTKETENAFLYTIGALARAAEMHDEDTADHIVRVGRYSEAIAVRLKCEESFVRTLSYSAQMHDVGKLYVHPDILRKPQNLSSTEWEEVKMHTIHGLHILGDDPRLAMAREIALNHHEHWDGSGYPNGLKKDEIPLSARIVILADVYDALRCKRSYKPAISHEEACAVITMGDERIKPHFFDPQILNVFKDVHPVLENIYESHQAPRLPRHPPDEEPKRLTSTMAITESAGS